MIGNKARSLVILSCLTGVSACERELPEGLVDAFRTTAGHLADAAESAQTITVTGIDGWLFFGPELRHLSVGPFWGDAARTASRARNPDAADPLPAILDFRDQLETLGVELLVVPVPPKSIVYPEKVSQAVDVPVPVPRLDTALQTFYDTLREQDVNVLDLTDPFIDDRFHPEGTLYCRQDTHWSGVGCVLAAQAIAAIVRDRDWYSQLETATYVPRWYSTGITGDLYAALDSPAIPREELRLRGIVLSGDGPAVEVEPDPNSPIVLLGDSHNLVFHAGGDMHATGAGLADQLAFELGFPVDLVAVRGSGATSARVNLLRRAQQDPSYWQAKRLVIWCFAARELTEGDGWSLVPVGPN